MTQRGRSNERILMSHGGDYGSASTRTRSIGSADQPDGAATSTPSGAMRANSLPGPSTICRRHNGVCGNAGAEARRVLLPKMLLEAQQRFLILLYGGRRVWAVPE